MGESANIGPTFQSDHVKTDGEVCDSVLDHVYYSSAFVKLLPI